MSQSKKILPLLSVILRRRRFVITSSPSRMVIDGVLTLGDNALVRQAKPFLFEFLAREVTSAFLTRRHTSLFGSAVVVF